MASVISVRELRKAFGQEEVLKGVSREFAAGQIHGIVGNNGSGKTVLMKCVCGFLHPTGGKVLVHGKEVGRETDFPQNLGIIIETPGFLPNLTGFKNLKLLASLQKKITEEGIRNAILRVGLDPALKKPVSKYSLGMRQRLGIAQAIMEDPSLLILDEPFNGLDKNGVAQMRELIKELRGEGKTILLASHNQTDIDELCDTVCEMDGGRMTMLRDCPAPEKPAVESCAAAGLTEELTLLENAMLPLTLQGVPRAERERLAAGALERRGLGKVLHAHPSMVSSEQQQMAAEVQTSLEERER